MVSSAVQTEAARQNHREVAVTANAASQTDTSSDSNRTDAQIRGAAAQDTEATVTAMGSERDLKATAILTSQTSESTDASGLSAAEIQKSLEDVALKSLATECENAEWWNAEKRSA
ncbi:MAG: hypothetical protein ACK50J_29690, partial [Planctomyces sp.]